MTGSAAGEGIRAEGGPLPADAATRPGYYGRPVLKPPVWTWEIPAYFFVGGLAGASAVLAWAARVGGAGMAQDSLVRAALWIALTGALLSAALLTSDLGRPERFLAMLRVFKWRSPMSVGVWTITGFGGFVTLGVAGAELHAASVAAGLADTLLTVGSWGGALLGAVVATYTGVLVGATAIPAWNRHHALLPVHFGVAGLGSAAGLLQLLGLNLPALWVVGVLASAVETLVGFDRGVVATRGRGPRAARGAELESASRLGSARRSSRAGPLSHRPPRMGGSVVPRRRAGEPIRLAAGRPRFRPRSGGGAEVAAGGRHVSCTLLNRRKETADRRLRGSAAAFGGRMRDIGRRTWAIAEGLIHDGSRVHITMVQLPGLNTPQFNWCRTKLPNHPQPVPPIFQPEVAAEGIVWASMHRRRELVVGMPSVKTIWGQKVAPAYMDRYLADHTWEGQQVDGWPVDPDRPSNLFEPVAGDHGAHGTFDDRAQDESPQLELNEHRGWALAGVGLGVAAVLGLAVGLTRS